MPDAPLCAALLDKIGEQIERTTHLIGLVPEGNSDWTPPVVAGESARWTVRQLRGHLLDCLAGNTAHDMNSKLQAFAVDVICEAFESLAIRR